MSQSLKAKHVVKLVISFFRFKITVKPKQHGQII